jgi:hypothetical protein
MEGNKMSDIFKQLKVWGIAFLIGGLSGGFVQQEFTIKAIEKDCQFLKAFRTYNKAYDCKERA